MLWDKNGKDYDGRRGGGLRTVTVECRRSRVFVKLVGTRDTTGLRTKHDKWNNKTSVQITRRRVVGGIANVRSDDRVNKQLDKNW